MRVAVVGLGMGGGAAACLLADAGHEVTVIERAADPRPVGAGIWLQAMGQEVLERLGLLEPLRAVSRPVTQVLITTSTGRDLIDVGYDRIAGSVPALGVHRGALFGLLHDAVRARGIPVALGVSVTGTRPTSAGMAVETAHGDHGYFDLVIGADGSRSAIRRSMNVTSRDHGYVYGALWSIVEDPEGLASDTLFQCLRGTQDYLGVLPTGASGTSVFWSVRADRMGQVVSDGLPAWRDAARPLAGPYSPLLDRVTELLPATYRDVVVRTPYRLDTVGGERGAVLIGDAAHAMSPQLGTGTSLALADAAALSATLGNEGDLGTRLRSYERSRAAHVRWYQWWTRLMMPVFQSDLRPLAWPRDLLAPTVNRIPWSADQMIHTLSGDRTSLRKRWTLPT